jgi:hypothetical protein
MVFVTVFKSDLSLRLAKIQKSTTKLVLLYQNIPTMHHRKGKVLPFPRRSFDQRKEEEKKVVLQTNLLTQLSTTLNHLRYQQSSFQFPITNTVMAKVRSAPLPEVQDFPHVSNQSGIHELDAAVYCQEMRHSLRTQAVDLYHQHEEYKRKCNMYRTN